MPLPEKVIEQMGRRSVQAPGWSGQLLMFSATLLFISAALYVGLTYGYEPYLEGKVNDLNNQIQKFSQEIPLADQTKIISFYSQLTNLKSLLDNHVSVSPLFAWLEKNTGPTVYYTKFSLNMGSNQLQIGGTAKSVNDVVSEIKTLEKQEEVAKVVLAGVNISQTGWQFDAAVYFKPNFLSPAKN